MSEEEGNKQMEGISELLRCYICMERLSNATICPHCSKLGCFACIKRWVTDNRSNCPHCRNALTLRDLIKIPLFDDLGQVLDNLHAVKKEVALSSSAEQEQCSVHREKMSVYCETCKKCICHECALWSQDHKGHTFKPLDVIYKNHVEVLQGELSKLKDRLKVILGQVQQVEKKIEGVKANKSKIKKELTHTVEKMFHQLDDTAKERVISLNDFRRYLSSQALEITKELHDLEKTITGDNISSLISSNGELKSEVSAVINRLLTSTHQIKSLPTIANFVNEVVPEYDSAIFKITSFRELQRKGEEVYSDPMVVQGLTWRLKVYPNGHKEEVGNYLAVFVELNEGYSTVTSYQYRIEMLYACNNKFPHRNHIREYASEFADGESWGYRKYYELSRLHEDGFIKDDTLVLKFSIRAPTYYQKFQDQTHFLDKIVKERDALKQQLESAKEQMSTLKREHKAKLAEQRQTTNSHTAPTQQDSHTPHQSLPMPTSSSQNIAHRRHHQHTHSAPHASHGHQRRERNSRLKLEDSRAFISHPPPPISQHRSPTHNPMHTHSSPKQSGHYHMGQAPPPHGESRIVSSGEAYHSHTHLYPGRRTSNEESPDMWTHITEQRRKSADSTMPQEHDPRVPRGHRAHGRRHEPTRSLSQHIPTSKTRPKSKFLESSSSEDLDAGFSQQWEEGVVNPADITITLQDEDGERVKSTTSSSSTLIDSGSPPREVKSPSQQKKYQDLSQEPFGDDDHKDMMSLSAAGPAPIPLSNFPLYYEPSSYFGEYQDHYPAPPPQPTVVSKHEYAQPNGGLSQPTYPSPPKSRHGKSLTDLTSSNVSLTSSSQQLLSQSAIDIQHMHDLHHSRQLSDTRRGTHDMRYRGSRGQLQRMASDSHLNKSYTPGLQKSIIYALSEVKEEVEHKKQQQTRVGKTSHPSSSSHHRSGNSQHQYKAHHSQPAHHSPHKTSHLQKTQLQATRVRGDSSKTRADTASNRQKPTSHNKKESAVTQKTPQDMPQNKSAKGEKKVSPTLVSPTLVAASVIVKEKRNEREEEEEGEVKDSSPHISTRHLGSKMKSNSTSSLNNLSQIL